MKMRKCKHCGLMIASSGTVIGPGNYVAEHHDLIARLWRQKKTVEQIAEVILPKIKEPEYWKNPYANIETKERKLQVTAEAIKRWLVRSNLVVTKSRAQAEAEWLKMGTKAIRLRDKQNLTFKDVGAELGVSANRATDIYYRAIHLKKRRARRKEAKPITLDTHIDYLFLSSRAENCLKNEGIATVRELVKKTEAELMRTPNLGRVSLIEILTVLAGAGLMLDMEVD